MRVQFFSHDSLQNRGDAIVQAEERAYVDALHLLVHFSRVIVGSFPGAF